MQSVIEKEALDKTKAHGDTKHPSAPKEPSSNPGNITNVLSKSMGLKNDGKHVRIASTAKWTCNTHDTYTVSEHSRRHRKGALCDRGANGIVFGDNVRMIFKTDPCVDIMGIDQHTMNNICIGTVGGVTETNKGPLILVMNQSAYHGRGHSIIAPAQLEAFGNIVEVPVFEARVLCLSRCDNLRLSRDFDRSFIVTGPD